MSRPAAFFVLLAAAACASAQVTLSTVEGGVVAPVGELYSFAPVALGSVANVDFRLTNTGSSQVYLTDLSVSGTYSPTPPYTQYFSVVCPLSPDLCGAAATQQLPIAIQPTGTLDFTVQFQPLQLGYPSATMNITAGTSAFTVFLTGTGVPAPPALVLLQGTQLLAAGQTISFGNVQVGSSETIVLTLANRSAVLLSVPAITLTGAGFSVSGSALSATSVLPGSSAELDVTFTSTAPGLEQGTLAIGSSTYPLRAGAPVLTVLQGNQPLADGQTISFPSIQLGLSQTIALTLANQTNTLLAVPAIPPLTGSFSVSGSALSATSVPPGSSIELDVMFTPAAVGLQNATLTIGESTYPLAGTGTAPPPLILLQGAQPVAAGQTISFGNVPVGSQQTIALTLANQTNVTLALPAVQPLTGGAFSLSGSALSATTVAPGLSAELDVTFSPGITGPQNATLTIGANMYPLQGTGLPPPLTVLQGGQKLAAGQALNFGDVQTGTQQTIKLTLANQSTITLAVPTIPPPAGSFSISGSALAATSVAPGLSTELDVTFSPTTMGPQLATLTIGANTYPLQGSGVAAAPAYPAPSIQLTPETLSSAQQGSLRVSLAAAATVAGGGTVTLAFQPAVSGVGDCPTAAGACDDPTIGFADGTFSAAFTVAQGASAGQFSGEPSVAFHTGTTAGTLTFTVTLGANQAQASVTIPPALIGVDAAVAARDVACDPALVYCTTTNIQLQINGWDNTRSTSQLVFSFFNSSGSEIAPGNITATELYFNGAELGTAAAFQQYFAASGMGGVFGLTVFFPVTGDADQVTTAVVQLTNSAGTATTSKITF